MLPSFRLIVATFLCGFLAVFAGLRITAAVRANHDALPNLATRAMPSLAASARAADAPRFEVTVPVMFDIKAVANVTPVVPIPVRLSPSDDPLPESAAPDQPAAVEAKPEPGAFDVTPPEEPAVLQPLTLLPGINTPVVAEAPPAEPVVLAPLTLLAGIPVPVLAETAPAEPVVLTPLSLLPDLPAPPEVAKEPDAPPAATEPSTPKPAAAAPPSAMDALAAVEPATAPDADVHADAVEPTATAPIKIEAVRLPRAKAKVAHAKTARAKRPRAARQASNDPFNFNFNQTPR